MFYKNVLSSDNKSHKGDFYMQISAISNSQPLKSAQSFGNSTSVVLPKKQDLAADKVEITEKENKASISDKIIKGAASLMVPGFGQLTNDEGSKAAKHFVSAAALTALTGATYMHGILKQSRTAVNAAGILGVMGMAVRVLSTIDAAKNAKADN